ncbi:MAG: hypothetical protein ACTSWY_03220 [Promethearchaeota archaeon]
MGSEEKSKKKNDFKLKSSAKINTKQKYNKIQSSIQKKIRFHFLLGISIPLILFLFEFVISINIFNYPDISPVRLWILQYLNIYNWGLAFLLLHIRIKKPKRTDKERKNNKYLNVGWLVIKTSHHKDNCLDHEVKIGEHLFCSGCFGGALGLIIGGILDFVYIFNFNSNSVFLGIILWNIGILFVIISLLKYLFRILNLKRLFVNASLPVGIWFMIIGTDIFFGNILSLIYYFIIIFFLAFERINLAKLEHKLIDFKSKEPC